MAYTCMFNELTGTPSERGRRCLLKVAEQYEIDGRERLTNMGRDYQALTVPLFPVKKTCSASGLQESEYQPIRSDSHEVRERLARCHGQSLSQPI